MSRGKTGTIVEIYEEVEKLPVEAAGEVPEVLELQLV